MASGIVPTTTVEFVAVVVVAVVLVASMAWAATKVCGGGGGSSGRSAGAARSEALKRQIGEGVTELNAVDSESRVNPIFDADDADPPAILELGEADRVEGLGYSSSSDDDDVDDVEVDEVGDLGSDSGSTVLGSDDDAEAC